MYPCVQVVGGPPLLGETYFFLSLSYQGMSSTAAVLIVTMGSSGAIVHLLNSLQTYK